MEEILRGARVPAAATIDAILFRDKRERERESTLVGFLVGAWPGYSGDYDVFKCFIYMLRLCTV